MWKGKTTTQNKKIRRRKRQRHDSKRKKKEAHPTMGKGTGGAPLWVVKRGRGRCEGGANRVGKRGTNCGESGGGEKVKRWGDGVEKQKGMVGLGEEV